MRRTTKLRRIKTRRMMISTRKRKAKKVDDD